MAMKTVAKFLTTRILVNSLDILMDHYPKYPNPNQFCLGLVLPYSTTIFSIKNPLKGPPQATPAFPARYHSRENVGKMSGNIKKCQEVSRKVRKCQEMLGNVGKC